jgi:predicted SAM-dependent methyltransferase
MDSLLLFGALLLITPTGGRRRDMRSRLRSRLVRYLPSSLVPYLRYLWIRYAKHRFGERVRHAPEGGLRIVVGAGGIPVEGWIESEVDFLDLLNPEDWERYFHRDSIDAILAEHVWEHLTPADGLIAARTCFHYLKPGGYLRIAVPDGHHPDPDYIDAVRVGGTGSGADDHKVLYTAEALVDLLREAGFIPELLEHFDEKGVFHEAQWDPQAGMIMRSRRFDPRNRDRLTYTSLIADAHKGL